MTDPINLSIGQPDFAVPEAVQAGGRARDSAKARTATRRRRASPPCSTSCERRIQAQYNHSMRQVFVTSGTSGGLVLAMLALVNPGDEVIVFDPYFVMYRSLVGLVGGTCVLVDTYPDFRIDVDKVAAAITRRTKAILFNSPGQSDRRHGQRRGDSRPGPTGRRAEYRAGERRDLQPLLATTSRSSRPPATIRRRSSSTGFPRATP